MRLHWRLRPSGASEHYDEIDAIFSRKGAYRRFKDFLARVGALERWYAYENEAKEKRCASGARKTGSTWPGERRTLRSVSI